MKKIEQVGKKIFIPAGQGGRMEKLVSVAGLVAFLVAGCGAEPEPQDNVASLATTQRASSSVSGEDRRPRLRLDMTAEEVDDLYRAYGRCMADNGFDKATISAGTVPSVDKEPLPVWEYDVANPEAEDFMHRLVQCLRDKGVDAGEARWSPSFPGGYDDSAAVGNALDATTVCEKELA